jgi:quercetin dioxygenase-like cupin family protein
MNRNSFGCPAQANATQTVSEFGCPRPLTPLPHPTTFTQFDSGSAATLAGAIPSGSLEWIPHPKFKGVFLKHLLTAAATEGALSCHLVSLAPGSRMELHVHEGKAELHEVMEGAGLLQLGDRQVEYRPGCLTFIPPNSPHAIVAGEKGLSLFAKFLPALV